LLGCGNGLLVYILNDLGYNGYGIDIQKRRVWDIYDLKDRLVERAVDPRTDTFEDCDWLIGNHSDELSPWLPIIANRSTTMNCNLFLIPCCFFDFNKKFDKKCDKKSRYDTYVDYLMKIFRLAGFFTYKDKLRIPSTKNICLVGIKSSISSAQDLKELDSMMNKESEVFQVRDVDKFMSKSMRNCTKNVDNKVKELIIQKVIGKMLTSDNCVYLTRYDNKLWNSGGVIGLDEVASLFDKDTLNKLKQECGGLKTLLKNHRQLFEIINKNSVRLRTDYNAKFCDDKNSDNFKKKRCLYDMMHPDGCFYENDKCTFLHQ
jgi:tRNASer (uridine44-2'-O)-methyltransferase